MIINTIDIIAFGNLKDFHLRLNDGLNVIYGDMENGKNTIIAFIKMLFYGSPHITAEQIDSSNTIVNERLKYRPTDSNSQMGGSIEFSFNGVDYRLTRIFKDSNTEDIVTLQDVSNHTTIDVKDDKKVGKTLLGIGESTFKKSIFINQITNGMDDNEIICKITNLITTCDEGTSFNNVQQRLTDAKECYLSKSGKIGILDKNRATLHSLYEDMNSAKAEESQKLQMQIDYEAVQENRDEIVARYDELKRTLTIQEMMSEVNSLKNLVAKFDNINDLKEEVSSLRQALTINGITVDKNFINKADKKLNIIQQIGERKNQLQSAVSRIKNELDVLTETLNTSHVEERQLYNEAVEQIEFTNGHIDNLDKSIEETKKELEDLKEKIKEADINFRVTDEQLKAKQDLDKQRMDLAQQQLTEARIPKVNENNATPLSTYIMLSVLIIIIGVVLAFTVNKILSIIPAIGLVMVLSTLAQKDNLAKKISKNNTYIDEVAVAKAIENLNNVRNNTEWEQHILVKKQREAQKQLNLLKLTEEQTISKVDKYEEQKKVLSNNLKYWINQRDETQKVFVTEQAKVDAKQDDLNNVLQGIEKAEQSFNNAQQDIINWLSNVKSCTNLNEVNNAINEYKGKLNHIDDLELQINTQTVELNSQTEGQSYDELKEKLTDVTADYIEMCGRDNPEPMSVAELNTLKNEINDCQFSLNMQNADLSYINSDIKLKFRNSNSVTDIEHHINHLERDIVRQEKFCNSVSIALDVLRQSFEEMKEYTNTLNSNTHKIFNQLTDGSHESLSIDKALKVASQSDNSIEDWKYLSSGTMEQAYLSLRLGDCATISNLNLPIVLDGLLIQYSDESTNKYLDFILEHSKLHQVIMFTYYKNVLNDIGSRSNKANLIDIS